MSSKFLNTLHNGDLSQLTNGTASIFIKSLKVSDLEGSKEVMTDDDKYLTTGAASASVAKTQNIVSATENPDITTMKGNLNIPEVTTEFIKSSGTQEIQFDNGDINLNNAAGAVYIDADKITMQANENIHLNGHVEVLNDLFVDGNGYVKGKIIEDMTASAPVGTLNNATYTQTMGIQCSATGGSITYPKSSFNNGATLVCDFVVNTVSGNPVYRIVFGRQLFGSDNSYMVDYRPNQAGNNLSIIAALGGVGSMPYTVAAGADVTQIKIIYTGVNIIIKANDIEVINGPLTEFYLHPNVGVSFSNDVLITSIDIIGEEYVQLADVDFVNSKFTDTVIEGELNVDVIASSSLVVSASTEINLVAPSVLINGLPIGDTTDLETKTQNIDLADTNPSQTTFNNRIVVNDTPIVTTYLQETPINSGGYNTSGGALTPLGIRFTPTSDIAITSFNYPLEYWQESREWGIWDDAGTLLGSHTFTGGETVTDNRYTHTLGVPLILSADLQYWTGILCKSTDSDTTVNGHMSVMTFSPYISNVNWVYHSGANGDALVKPNTDVGSGANKPSAIDFSFKPYPDDITAIIPSATDTLDLGSVANRFNAVYAKDIFVSNNSIHMGDNWVMSVADDEVKLNHSTDGLVDNVLTLATSTNSSAVMFKTTFAYLASPPILYQDEWIRMSWSAGGNDLEVTMLALPPGLSSGIFGGMVSSASLDCGTPVKVSISEVDTTYDVYGAGYVTDNARLDVWLAANGNPTAPFPTYNIKLHRVYSVIHMLVSTI